MLGFNGFCKIIAILLFEVWMCALQVEAQTVAEYPTGHFSIYQNQVLGNPAPVLGENVGQLSFGVNIRKSLNHLLLGTIFWHPFVLQCG